MLTADRNLLLIDASLTESSMENLKDVVDPAKTHLLVVNLEDPYLGVLDQLDTLPDDKYTSVGIVVFGSELDKWGLTLLSKDFAQMLQSVCINASDDVLPSVDIFAWDLPVNDASIISLSLSLQKSMAVFITSKQKGDYYLEHCYLAGQLLRSVSTEETTGTGIPDSILLVEPGKGLDLRTKYLDKSMLEKKGQFVFSTKI